jgi:site-specific recombinase XerD
MTTNPYRVKTIICKNGERLPLLISSTTGLPVRFPNRWVLISRRTNNQTSTLERELRTIGFLYTWAEQANINLDDRLATGNGLTAEEINPCLYDWMRKDFTQSRILKKLSVTSNTHRSRLETIREYLLWRLDETLSRMDVGDSRFDRIQTKRDLIKKQLERDLPSHRLNRRIGLEAELRQYFLKIIQPQHPENPWRKQVRQRNYLLCLLYLTFGLRRAEALKIYLSDVHLNGERPTLTVKRKPDDAIDPRVHEPKVKTLGRIIPLEHTMVRLLNEYILKHRNKIPNAKKSPFLFLSSSTGKPLSSVAINNIIWQITKKHPSFEGVLSPHILRHSYNDLLSEIAEKNNIPEHDAREIRNYLCGWARSSEQGNNYRQRYIKQKSFELSLKHQEYILSQEDLC